MLLPFEGLNRTWCKGREKKDEQSGSFVFPDARAEEVATNIKGLAEKKRNRGFKARREVKDLSITLRNKEHPSHVCGGEVILKVWPSTWLPRRGI